MTVLHTWVVFLGAFEKLRKATISLVVSVRPSVRSHGTYRLLLDGFSWNFSSFRHSVEKIQVGTKPDKNNRYFKVTTYVHL
jgi:hypothetical protein